MPLNSRSLLGFLNTEVAGSTPLGTLGFPPSSVFYFNERDLTIIRFSIYGVVYLTMLSVVQTIGSVVSNG
jgi:hypothetical protein